MTDSHTSEELAEKRAQARDGRIEAVKQWVAYIRAHPPESWGAQQNRLVNAQLESARQSGLGADHYCRLDRAGRRRRPPDTE
ncbi:MAG: hypothetical protein ABEH77_08165 [Halobacteriaceae archaeon]